MRIKDLPNARPIGRPILLTFDITSLNDSDRAYRQKIKESLNEEIQRIASIRRANAFVVGETNEDTTLYPTITISAPLQLYKI